MVTRLEGHAIVVDAVGGDVVLLLLLLHRHILRLMEVGDGSTGRSNVDRIADSAGHDRVSVVADDVMGGCSRGRPRSPLLLLLLLMLVVEECGSGLVGEVAG